MRARRRFKAEADAQIGENAEVEEAVAPEGEGEEEIQAEADAQIGESAEAEEAAAAEGENEAHG